MRSPALGRNIWLFARRATGGEATATWLMVIPRTRLQAAEPFG